MGRVQIVFLDYVEDALRDEAKRKGDISKIVNDAVIKHLRIPHQQSKPIEFKVKEK